MAGHHQRPPLESSCTRLVRFRSLLVFVCGEWYDRDRLFHGSVALRLIDQLCRCPSVPRGGGLWLFLDCAVVLLRPFPLPEATLRKLIDESNFRYRLIIVPFASAFMSSFFFWVLKTTVSARFRVVFSISLTLSVSLACFFISLLIKWEHLEG